MSAAFFTRSRNGPSPVWPRNIEALRALLDTRLAALEAALADPDQYDSLEQLLGDLVRTATEEADATVRQACLEAQREAQNAIAAARGEAQAALEAERGAAASLRHDVERAHAMLQAERAAAAVLSGDLDAAQLTLDQEQTTTATLRRELDEARATADARGRDLDEVRLTLNQEQTSSATLRHELDEARAAADAHGRDLDEVRLTPDQEQAMSTNLRRELAEAQAAAEAERTAAALLRETVARLEQELAGAREDTQTRLNMLKSVQTDLNLALREAEARAQAAIDERDELAARLEAASDEVGEDARARYERLGEAAKQQISALELALSDAEVRARAALDELELRRGEIKPHRRDSAAKSSPASAASRPQPLRQTARYMISGELEVQVDGSSAWLIDLSFSGAQVLSSTSLKPNTVVRLVLPLGDRSVVCKGKIMWAQIDPAKRGSQLRYRAGVSFTAADQAGIKAFLARHISA